MKKHVLIIAVLALFSFSCSTEDATESIDQNVSLENQTKMIMFLKSDQFKEYMIAKNNHHRNNQSKIAGEKGNNGIMVLESPYGTGIGYINWETWEFTFIGGDDGSIEKLPNGRGKFSVHTNNPVAFYSDSGDISLSSECVDGPRGTFNFNIISDYTVEVYDFGEFGIFTFYNWTDVNSSAITFNGHCKVSDSGPVYDEQTWELIEACSGATIYKTIRVKGNDLKGFSLSVE